MDYKHLTTFEQSRIEILNKLGYSTRYIANSIGRHHSTVARELSRNCTNYNAEKSEANYRLRRENAKPKGKSLMNWQIKFKIFFILHGKEEATKILTDY